MNFGLFLLVLALSFSGSHGFAHWKMLEIEQHHEFFASRALEEELQTVKSAESAVQSLFSSFKESLSKVVDYQQRELENARRQTVGTYNEDCINGLSSYMTKAIREVTTTYDECSEEVPSKLTRGNKYLRVHKEKYFALYNKTISDINHCVINYAHNRESRDLIEKCISSHEERYFQHSNGIQWVYNIDASPAMSVFRGTVLKCVGEAFDSIVRKGTEFLGKMKCCVNSTAFLHWKPVQNTLREQIDLANQLTKIQVSMVENEIKTLYSSRLLSAEKYLYLGERNEYLKDLMYSLMIPYFHTVNLTGLHNPGDWQCLEEARTALHNISQQGGSQLLEWDNLIRKNTSQLLNETSERILSLKKLMPFLGNVALLNCFSQGYVFAPNTVLDCFKLTHTQFDINHRQLLEDTQADLRMLGNYLEYFKDRLKYPGVNFCVERSYLEGERVLYELQRCLYQSSATVYPVTTPGTTTSGTTIPGKPPTVTTTKQDSWSVDPDSPFKDYTTTEEYTTTEDYPTTEERGMDIGGVPGA